MQNSHQAPHNKNTKHHRTLPAWLQTLVLTSLGTAVLVSMHHAKRKQQNQDAKWRDYVDGVLDKTIQVLHTLKSETSNKPSDLTKQPKGNQQEILDSTHQNHPEASDVAWVSGVADLKTHHFAVVGIDASRQIVWQTTLPERVHDIVVQPYLTQRSCHVAVMGRRPSERFWVLDGGTGAVLHALMAGHNRHFYGHGCYSLDGQLLYITENDTESFAGKIGVYAVNLGYQKIQEFDTGGIGPHELVMHPDGDTLIVANGGIKTEKASREELNLDSMQPSLAYIHRKTGEILERVYPKHRQMSIRHLSIHENGMVAIGIQFQGERHLDVPLLLTHQRGQPTLTPLQISLQDQQGWHRFHHYIASVAVDSVHDLLCATSPIAGCVAIFDLKTGAMLASGELPDCAGVAVWTPTPTGETCFLVSDGQGYLNKIGIQPSSNDPTTNTPKPPVLTIDRIRKTLAFDNHLQRQPHHCL